MHGVVHGLAVGAVDGTITVVVPEHVWLVVDGHCGQSCKGLIQNCSNDDEKMMQSLMG